MATSHYIPNSLLTVQNAKTIKGEELGYLTGILYLAPANESGVVNLCVNATGPCIAACLFKAGRASFDPSIIEARINKTHYLVNDREGFMAHLRSDIDALQRKANREGLKLAIRINGTSDLPWIPLQLSREYPNVLFYDYTKHPKSWLRIRENYKITFSYSGENLDECKRALNNGVNVSVVFSTRKGHELPETWNGYRVIDGDEHDLRFLDPKGVVVGLRAKGPATKQVSPFIVLA
jgi:hypothetical protein